MWAGIEEVARAVSGIDSEEAGHEPLQGGIDASREAALSPASDLGKPAVLRGPEHDHVGAVGLDSGGGQPRRRIRAGGCARGCQRPDGEAQRVD